MTAKELGNQPAMPRAHFTNANGDTRFGGFGMTLRQHYAGLAMQGFCSSNWVHHADIAAFAVQQADRLLAELAKEQPEAKQ